MPHHPGGEVGAGDGTARRERLLLAWLGQVADDGAGADQPPQRRLRCGAAGPALALLVLALSVGLAGNYTVKLDDHVACFERAAVGHRDPVIDFRRWLGLDLDDVLVLLFQRGQPIGFGLFPRE